MYFLTGLGKLRCSRANIPKITTQHSFPVCIWEERKTNNGVIGQTKEKTKKGLQLQCWKFEILYPWFSKSLWWGYVITPVDIEIAMSSHWKAVHNKCIENRIQKHNDDWWQRSVIFASSSCAIHLVGGKGNGVHDCPNYKVKSWHHYGKGKGQGAKGKKQMAKGIR